jgi:hypothetical protein
MTRRQPAPLSATLPGTWELVTRTDVDDAGRVRLDPALGSDPIALLVYDRSGHFSAQFMKRDRSTPGVEGSAAATNNTIARGGYDAYFGSYRVDDAAGTVTQTLLGALSQESVGRVLTRAMQVDGDRLTIALRTSSVTGEMVTRTLVWRRVG